MAAKFDNSPSFSLQRQSSQKVQSSLELLSNLQPGDQHDRNIVVATSLTEQAAASLIWAVKQLCRTGDAVHLCHVVCCLRPQLEVYHSGPGNSYTFEESEPHHERHDVLQAQRIIRQRLLPHLEAAKLGYEVHLFVDTENAPADAIGSTILRLATQLDAAAVVLAASDEDAGDPQRLGSVADWVFSQQQPHALVFVRQQQLALQEELADDHVDAAEQAAGNTETQAVSAASEAS